MRSYFDERTRARDAAARLHGMLRELRGAPRDARDFHVFDRRDDWKEFGVGDEEVAAVDLTDNGALDEQIAQAGAVARALGHVDESDTISGGSGDDLLYGGAGDDALADPRFQPGQGAENLGDLRRQQANFKAAVRAPPPAASRGGVYGDVGFGYGPGFNLHFDREGTTASAGAGVFGTAKLGYAPDLQALRAQRQNDRVFGGLQVKVGRRRVGLQGEARYKTVPHSLAFDGAALTVGPVQGAVDARWRRSVGVPMELGFEGGSGALKTLSTRPWKR